MNPKSRPIPFPKGTEAYHQEMLRLKNRYEVRWRFSWRYNRQLIRIANELARRTPMPGEKCGARCRTTGLPCQAKATPSGRCRWHGGCSTGPRTAAGKARSAANLPTSRARDKL
jgi:hypothetical protein